MTNTSYQENNLQKPTNNESIFDHVFLLSLDKFRLYTKYQNNLENILSPNVSDKGRLGWMLRSYYKSSNRD